MSLNVITHRCTARGGLEHDTKRCTSLYYVVVRMQRGCKELLYYNARKPVAKAELHSMVTASALLDMHIQQAHASALSPRFHPVQQSIFTTLGTPQAPTRPFQKHSALPPRRDHLLEHLLLSDVGWRSRALALLPKLHLRMLLPHWTENVR